MIISTVHVQPFLDGGAGVNTVTPAGRQGREGTANMELIITLKHMMTADAKKTGWSPERCSVPPRDWSPGVSWMGEE